MFCKLSNPEMWSLHRCMREQGVAGENSVMFTDKGMINWQGFLLCGPVCIMWALLCKTVDVEEVLNLKRLGATALMHTIMYFSSRSRYWNMKSSPIQVRICMVTCKVGKADISFPWGLTIYQFFCYTTWVHVYFSLC